MYFVGVELSTDDETPSLSEKEKTHLLENADHKLKGSKTSTWSSEPVNTTEEVEDGVEAVEDLFEKDSIAHHLNENWDDCQNVNEEQFKTTYYENTPQQFMTVSPNNFIDLRNTRSNDGWYKFIVRCNST